MTEPRRSSPEPDAGSSLVELVVAVPMIVLGVLAGLQFAAVGVTDLMAAEAAHAGSEGVRAGVDPRLAIDRELGELYRPFVRAVEIDGGRVQVSLDVPVLMPRVRRGTWVVSRVSPRRVDTPNAGTANAGTTNDGTYQREELR